MGPRRIPIDRRRQVRCLVGRLRAAIDREPLLRRLPGERELAAWLGRPRREVRYALDELVRDEWIEPARSGYRVVRRPPSQVAIQNVVLVQRAAQRPSPLTQHVAFGADARCRSAALSFQMRWVGDDRLDGDLEALAAEMPGRHVGWALMVPPAAELLDQWQAEDRRVVLVDHVHPSRPVPAVLLDHAAAARLAVQHLGRLGHRRIASILHPQSNVEQLLRLHGARDLPDWDLTVAPSEADATDRVLRDWAARWRTADDRPTAVVACNLTTAALVLGACEVMGIDVPADLSVLALGSACGRKDWLARVTLANSGSASALGRAAVNVLAAEDFTVVKPVTLIPASLDRPGTSVARPVRARRESSRR